MHDGAALGGFRPVVVGTTVFTDDTLLTQSTPIKAVHLTELRTAVNALRTKWNLALFTWGGTAPAPGGSVRASHLIDLRTALTQAYEEAGRTPPTFTGSIAAREMSIKASHLNELRTYVHGLE